MNNEQYNKLLEYLLNGQLLKEVDKILKQIKKNRKVFSLQNKKDYYQLGEY